MRIKRYDIIWGSLSKVGLCILLIFQSFQVFSQDCSSDESGPVILDCPADINNNIIAPECGTIAIWTEPTAYDSCGSVVLTSTHNSGDYFPRGKTTVTYTATDEAGNTSTCSFNIFAKDVTKPELFGCPTNDIIAAADEGCVTTITWDKITAADNCDSVKITSTHKSGDTFPLGTTKVAFTATDVSGNFSKCSFNVVVSDTSPPNFTRFPSDTIVAANEYCEAYVNWDIPVLNDNCNATFTSTHLSKDTFPLGTTTVIYTATDDSGNTTTASFQITVEDKTEPVIFGCPANDIEVSSGADCSAIVTWGEITALDNCGSVGITSSHISGDLFSVGTTKVIYTATDSSGNSAVCSFNVIVKDSIAPTFASCPRDTAIAVINSCNVSVTWEEPKVVDNCGVFITSTHNSGDIFELGSTIVKYYSVDSSGHIDSCAFIITIYDELTPILENCPSDITVLANDDCQAFVSWEPPAVSDNCEVALSSSHTPGATFALGTTMVKYYAVDASGNRDSCSFNIIVKDETAPILNGCPSDIKVFAGDMCYSSVSWVVPTVTDNCSVNMTSNYNPGDVFPLDTTTVIYTAEDAYGNVSSCSFNVIVADEMAPQVFNCPSDIFIDSDSLCTVVVSWDPPEFSDGCTVQVSSSHEPDDTFSFGTTRVTYLATDGNGNRTECAFNITIQPGQPVFSECPDDIDVKADESGEVNVYWEEPQATTYCGDIMLTSSHIPGNLFSLGTTEVIYTATDDLGNSTSCSFEINVSHRELNITVTRIISPNGDGENDLWIIPNIEKFKNNKVVVLDRSGNEIYEATGYNNESISWGGNNKYGQPVPTGTYYYFISVSYLSEVIEKKGFIELIRP